MTISYDRDGVLTRYILNKALSLYFQKNSSLSIILEKVMEIKMRHCSITNNPNPNGGG